MLDANAIISGYLVFDTSSAAQKDRVVAVSDATLAKVGGSILCDLGEPNAFLRETLQARGVAAEHIAVIPAPTLHVCGVTPKARDRVRLRLQNHDGTMRSPEVFTVTDVMRPSDPGLAGAIDCWALTLSRGGGNYTEATP